jgi:hypothetical protein
VSASRLRGTVRSRRAIVRASLVLGACVPLVAGCATGFGAPTRHAIANLQAASVDVGQNLLIRGLIVAVPDGTSADKGGTAYIEFTATNLSDQPDELQGASATIEAAPAAGSSAPASGAASAAAGAVALSSNTSAVGSTKIPAKNERTPGVARLVVALTGLSQRVSQGESVLVTLQFANSGSVSDIHVPVQGSDVVGSSFLPTAVPSAPASSSPGELVSQSPAVNSANSAPASQPASVSPSPATSS